MDKEISNNECPFCLKFNSPNSSLHKWYDEELFSYDNFVVVPALGSFVEGYLMIVTRQHYPNMGSLSISMLNKLSTLKLDVKEVLTRQYRSPIIFEHGPSFSLIPGGGCIDHAHFQILPLDEDIIPEIRKKYNIVQISNLTDLVEFRESSKPYLFIENQQGQMFVCEVDNTISQFVRRLIAIRMGIPDQWDYDVFPRYEVISATIKKLKPWPSTLSPKE